MEAALRQDLIDTGQDSIDGKLFHAAISRQATRTTCDYHNVFTRLPQTQKLKDLVEVYTHVSRYVRVTVGSRH